MFMGWIAVYVTGLGGSKSGRRAQGPEAGSRRLTAAFFFVSQKPGSAEPSWDLLQWRWKCAAIDLRVVHIIYKSQPCARMDIGSTTNPCECYTVGSPYPRECGRCGSRHPRSVKPFPALPLPAVSEAMFDKSCSKASTMLPLKLIGPEALMFPGSP